MPNPSAWEIDRAVMGVLQADLALQGLVPDGVFYDLATPGAKRFVIVSRLDSEPRGVYGQRAIVDVLYLVKAVGLSTVFTKVQQQQAADRIDALLQDQPLTVNGGYTWMSTDCERLHRAAPADAVDNALQWLEGGGDYRVRASVPLM